MYIKLLQEKTGHNWMIPVALLNCSSVGLASPSLSWFNLGHMRKPLGLDWSLLNSCKMHEASTVWHNHSTEIFWSFQLEWKKSCTSFFGFPFFLHKLFTQMSCTMWVFNQKFWLFWQTVNVPDSSNQPKHRAAVLGNIKYFNADVHNAAIMYFTP